MQEQPAVDSPPPPGRWAPGQAALVAAVVILAVAVGATLAGQAGLLPQSDAAVLNAVFLGTCGLVAGLIGAGQRRKERWPGAATAYRLAMWCFFLAALHAVKYHVAERDERIRQALERYERQQRGRDAEPSPEP
jgi:DMSO/TMAO reductase YedYZ heme-binding membrane subunit